jgi:hypothetical protein
MKNIMDTIFETDDLLMKLAINIVIVMLVLLMMLIAFHHSD